LLKHLQNKYHKPIYNVINRIKNIYNQSEIKDIVCGIDNGITFAGEKYTLSLKRKELIIKIITKRTNKLLTGV